MIHYALHLVGICHEVARQITTVELHTLNNTDVGVTALALLDSDHTVLAYLTESLCQEFTDLWIVVGRYGSYLLDLIVVVVNLLRTLLDILYNSCNSLVDTTLQIHRVSSGSHVLQTNVDDALSQDGSGSSSVTGIVTSLAGNTFQQLCSGILKTVFQLDLLGYGDTVLGDLRSTKLLLNDYVTAFRTKCYFNCVSQLIYTILEQIAGIHIEFNIFCHD